MTGLRQKGLTLFEVLVVVFVISIIVGVVVPRVLVKSDAQIKEETHRLNRLITLASEQALLQGRDIGLSFEESQYRFYVFDLLQQGWLPLEKDGSFRTRELPQGIRLELSLGETPYEWPEAEEDDDQDSDSDELNDAISQPQVLILSTGEISPFDVYLSKDGLDIAMQLSVLIDGEREIIRHDYQY